MDKLYVNLSGFAALHSFLSRADMAISGALLLNVHVNGTALLY